MLEDFFENYFKIEKAYRKYFQDEMEKYHLTPNELLVLLFWHATTADAIRRRDIAQYEGVCQGTGCQIGGEPRGKAVSCGGTGCCR